MKFHFIVWIFLGFFYQSLYGNENFILIDGSTSNIIRELGADIEKRVTPACSFNIALSLMGYDIGVLQDEETPVWDFQEGYDDLSELWKFSQTPQTWMTRSCVWFSKLIALHLGLKTIKHYLSAFEYGNQDLSTGMIQPGLIDPAWVSASLKISPKEQVNFVQKMIQGKLPISDHALQITKKILFKEEMMNGWKLFGKTGLGTIFDENNENLKIRWFVGWIEKDDHYFSFAYQLQKKEVDVFQTVPRVKQLLNESREYIQVDNFFLSYD